MIDESVLVEVVGLLSGHIQDSGRLDVSVLVACDELGVHAQVTHAVCADLLGKGNRHNLFLGGNESSGLFDDGVDGVETFLNGGKPSLIHDLVKDSVVVLELVVACLNHLKKVPEIPVVLQRLTDFIRIF